MQYVTRQTPRRRRLDVEPLAFLASGAAPPPVGLAAVSVESATEVSSPILGQVHALTATDVESASEVTAPAIGQIHALTATDVESASEVTAPAIGQSHVLTAVSVESATEVTAPALAEGGALIGTPGRIIARTARVMRVSGAARNYTITRTARNWRIAA